MWALFYHSFIRSFTYHIRPILTSIGYLKPLVLLSLTLPRLRFQPFSESGLTSSSHQRLDHWTALLVRDVTSSFLSKLPGARIAGWFTCVVHNFTMRFRPNFVKVNTQQHLNKGKKDHIYRKIIFQAWLFRGSFEAQVPSCQGRSCIFNRE